MTVLALAVGILIRTWSGADPALVVGVSPDATSYRVDAASYAFDSRCVMLAQGGHKCTVLLLGGEKNIRHTVTACKNQGTLCGGTKREPDISCYCPAPPPWDCPDLFPVASLPMVPTGLTATAVSDSEIALEWDEVCGADGYIIERSTTETGPWAEIGRVP